MLIEKKIFRKNGSRNDFCESHKMLEDTGNPVFGREGGGDKQIADVCGVLEQHSVCLVFVS